jgi:hypothetical protein
LRLLEVNISKLKTKGEMGKDNWILFQLSTAQQNNEKDIITFATQTKKSLCPRMKKIYILKITLDFSVSSP